MQTLVTVFLYFIVYCFIGWVYESIVESIRNKRLVNRGYLASPLIPIYGFGALLTIACFQDYTDLPTIWLFVLCGVLACSLEYVTSWLMEKIFQARWWDYSGWILNLNGRVCLFGFLAFGLLLVLLLRVIHPFVSTQLERVPQVWQYWIAGGLFVLVLTDTVLTTVTVVQMELNLATIQRAFNRASEQYRAKMDGLQGQVEQWKEELQPISAGKKVLETLEQSEFYTKTVRLALRRYRLQERRLLHAFPQLKSLKYTQAFDHVQWFYRNRKLERKSLHAQKLMAKKQKKKK